MGIGAGLTWARKDTALDDWAWAAEMSCLWGPMGTERIYICSRPDIYATYHWMKEPRVGERGLCWMEELDLPAGRVTLLGTLTRRGQSLLGKETRNR